MGARAFELDLVIDEVTLLTDGWISVDSVDFTQSKRVSYATLRRPSIQPQYIKTAPYTLQASDNGAVIAITAPTTLTTPIAAALGAGFRCTIYADGVTATLSRVGGGSMNLISGDLAKIEVVNNKVLATKLPATVL